MQSKIGITFEVPENADYVGVYVSESGVDVFETNDPYVLSDGKSLISPLPVIEASGLFYIDRMGNAQSSLVIKPAASPDGFSTWDQGAQWDNETYWS